MTRREDLQKDGYLVVPGMVPADLCQAVVADIEWHVAGDEHGEPSLPDGYGWVEMYHHQSMWDVRQYPAVHAVFAELFGTEKLWVSIDRCNCKYPLDEHAEGHSFIHWDACVNERPRPFAIQGVVALADTDETMGGFRCLPGLYRNLDTWLAGQPCGKAQSPFLRPPYPYGPVVKVPMRAGDLLVWDGFLPHGNGPNRGSLARFAQYGTMRPPGDERERQERIDCWEFNKPPAGWAFPGDPRGIEQRRELPARLTVLGNRLLGKDEW